MPLGLTIDAPAGGVAFAFALGRSFRGRTYVLLSLLILMFVQSVLALTMSLIHPLPPPPSTHPASNLWPIFSALIAVNSGLIAIGALAAGPALFFEFGKSRFGISKTLPQYSSEKAPADQNLNRTFSKFTILPFLISTFSLLSSRVLRRTVGPDVFPAKPPIRPSDLTTLWHGTRGAYGFFRHAFPTALYAFVFSFSAISP